jgi:nucleoside-diphosphate-sugar epimerase
MADFRIGKQNHRRLTFAAFQLCCGSRGGFTEKMTGQRALITGGSGYFGSLLRDRLLERGQTLRVFDLSDADDRPNDVEFAQGDIRNASHVSRAVAACDTIYHCVAQVPLAKARELFHSVNVHGTENLLRAAYDAKVRKVIYISSSAVFGAPKSNPVTEETPPTPGESYGRAKLEGETLCRQFAERGLDVTIIRPRTIMGHGRLGIFQILFEWIRDGYNVPVLGRGDNIYQFVHADDLVKACTLAAGRPGPTTYNCGAASFGTMRQALENLCSHANTGSKVRSVPMSPAVGAMKITSALGLSPLGAYHALMYGRSLYFDISRAQRELNWRPRFSTDQMFAQSYDWYLANREKILSANKASHHRSAVKQGILSLVKHLL